MRKEVNLNFLTVLIFVFLISFSVIGTSVLAHHPNDDEDDEDDETECISDSDCDDDEFCLNGECEDRDDTDDENEEEFEHDSEEFEERMGKANLEGMKGMMGQGMMKMMPMEMMKDFSGPGGCKTREECEKYCMDNQEECMKFWQENKPGMMGKMDMPGMKIGPIGFPEEMNPKEMVVGFIFREFMHDLHPEDFMEYCPDTKTMIDKVFEEINKRSLNMEEVCSKISHEFENCKEHSSDCEKIMESNSGPGKLECPPDRNEIIEECKEMVKVDEPNMREECEKAWTENVGNFGSRCETIRKECDESEFMRKCEEDKERSCRERFGDEEINYAMCIQEYNCRGLWENKKTICESESVICDKDKFLSDCMNKDISINPESRFKHCEEQANTMLEKMNMMCNEREFHHKNCIERSQNACDFIQKAFEECRSMNLDNVRVLMEEKASFMCKMKDHHGHFGEIVSTMARFKDQLPADMEIVVDESAEDLINVDERIKEATEGKGLLYKLRAFLGLAAEEEKREAEILRESASKLESNIATLNEIASRVGNEEIRNLLLQQNQDLQQRLDDLRNMANKKEDKASGIFSILGSFLKS